MMNKIFPLSQAPLDTPCTVIAINDKTSTRRRLFDLGLLPNTTIMALFRSPFKQPTAYQVIGSTIAIRNETADQILVCLCEDPSHEENIEC